MQVARDSTTIFGRRGPEGVFGLDRFFFLGSMYPFRGQHTVKARHVVFVRVGSRTILLHLKLFQSTRERSYR